MLLMDVFVCVMQIVNGPQICILLKANITMPDMQISTDVLDFEEVNCGECKVITVQLYNHKHVRCEWNSLPTEKEKKKVRNSGIIRKRQIPPPPSQNEGEII